MRYHFVLNGYLQNCQKVLQEMEAFKHTYLSCLYSIFCKNAVYSGK